MDKHVIQTTDAILDDDILQVLADSHAAIEIPSALKSRMRANILDQVKGEEAATLTGFKTIRAAEGEWVSPVPGASVKLLHQEGEILTYLARLEPGFEMQGHPHPVDEECIMLEGDLWLGDLHLQAGDYHYAPKGVHHGRLKSDTGALVFLKGPLPV